MDYFRYFFDLFLDIIERCLVLHFRTVNILEITSALNAHTSCIYSLLC